MAARPKALILDYTGVITVPLSMGGPDPEPAAPSSVASDAPPSGPESDVADAGASIRRLRALMAHELDNPDPNGLWNRLERGEAPLADLLEQIEAAVPGAGVFFAGEGPASLDRKSVV